ncbi:hypothetical protein G6F47_011569 [Rhizopus delemar]|nr:hypothetical protein G6F54_011458 [Rhizopus delemar]KAG1499284.1 hypothetical protein G6F53_011553 [Rhizopus delemar]KAG1585098.1 hypothetical protein G6F47_011569 [Rhizopus delemar]
MNINEALISFFDGKGRKTLYNFITTHTPLVENYIRQFSKAADARKNLVNKFKSEYKIKNSRSKRSPAITFDFDTLWSSTQVNKILTNERDKVSVALIKASSAEIRKKLQVPVAEEEEEKEEEENQNTADKSNNGEQTLREEDGDDDYSNERSDDATDENLVYIFNNNEDEFTSIISSDEGVPVYLKQSELFQLKAFKKAKTVGLFVNADLYQIL